jgi:excisionase family DNA binding protein
MADSSDHKTDEYLSTREAAMRLGVSLGTVQNMVETGRLVAWKTTGGHRRVSLRSIEAYLADRPSFAPHLPNGERMQVLVIEADETLRDLYQSSFAKWDMPIDCHIVDNAYDGMIQVGLDKPDVLIVDPALPGLDGFQLIRAIRHRSELAKISIVIISKLTATDIAEQGGLPADVTVYGKPVPLHELRGYFQALVTQRARQGALRAL